MLVHAWGATQVMSFNYPSWSISAEWFAYLTFPAVVWIVRRGGATAALIVAGVIVAMLEMAVYRGLLAPWTTLTNHFGALRALPTFLIGAAIAQSLDRIPLRLKTFAPSWGLFVAAFGAMLLHFDDRLIVVMLIACLIATVVAERDGATGLLTRPLMARFGDYSYAIYMIHPLIAVVFINLVSGKILHLSGAWLMIWCAFCAVVPNVLIGSLIYRRVESPARRWIRNSQPLRALRWLWAEGAAKRKSW